MGSEMCIRDSYLHTARNINKKTVLRQHCVERSYRIFSRFGYFRVIFCDEIGIFCCFLAKRTDDHSVGKKPSLGQCLVVKSVVKNKVKRCTEIGNIALEILLWIGRNVQPVDVQTVVGSEQ